MKIESIIRIDFFRRTLFFLIVVINPINGIYAQQIQVSGKVTDTLQTSLPCANILAILEANDQDVRFAITQENGHYKLGLSKNQTYKITVSYLGYTPQSINITTTNRDLIKNFILKENPIQLDNVT